MWIQGLELVTQNLIVIFKFELKEALEIPDNTVCYVDDISIPHTWRTIESHNNKLYIIFKIAYMAGGGMEMTMENNYDAYVLEIPEGNYTGISLASAIQELLNNFNTTLLFEVNYNSPRGSITIKATSEGIAAENAFIIPSDFGIMTWLSITNNAYPWKNKDDIVQVVDINNLQSINGVFRNTDTDFNIIDLQDGFYRTWESGFLDLLNIHNIYMHCPNLGHFNSIGCKGENSIIKKVPVSSSFGYLILDSVVSPHDKMDVSRQTVRTIHISLRDVYGTVMNLHGASISFSLVFVTTEYLFNLIFVLFCQINI